MTLRAFMWVLSIGGTLSSCSQDGQDSLESKLKEITTAASIQGTDLTRYAWEIRKSGNRHTNGLWAVLQEDKSYAKWSEKVFARVGPTKDGEWVDGGGSTVFVVSLAQFVLYVLLDLLGSQYHFADLDRMEGHERRHWRQSFQEWYEARKEFLEWHPDTWTWRLNWNLLVASHFKIAHTDARLLREALVTRLNLKGLRPGEPVVSFVDKHLIPALCAKDVRSSRDLIDGAPWHFVTTPDSLAEAIIEVVPIELRFHVAQGLVVNEMSTVRLCLRWLGKQEVYLALQRALVARQYKGVELIDYIFECDIQNATAIELERRTELMFSFTTLPGRDEYSGKDCTSHSIGELRHAFRSMQKAAASYDWAVDRVTFKLKHRAKEK